MLTGTRERGRDGRPPAARRRLCGALAAVSLAFVTQAFAGDGDPAAGEKLFRDCKSCHEIGENARHKVGPHLDGIIGRTAGSAEGFRYSRALRQAGEDGLVWDEEALSAYIEKPRDFIKGNRMSYRGMADAQDRADLIAYLSRQAQAAPAEDTSARQNAGVTGFAQIVLQMEGDPEYGEYLAGECVTCHQATGHADGIPSIVGVPKDYFIRALFEYKNNIRSNEVMKLRVANLTNEEIAALAAYFSGLEPQ
ncbi:c-type cytochrome [Zhengella sp. ZM62]|uniref:c-type cytochrome n=1 Tax=Zhengella sedimenti TaxID=3390035 RepID=UPI0039761E37